MLATRLDNRSTPQATATGEGGFTLIELLAVLVILGILIAMAIPAYLGFQARAADSTAKSNLRGAVIAVEEFAMDNVGARGDADNRANTSGYKGMTASILLAKYDPGLSPSVTVVSSKTTAAQFCIAATQDSRTWSLLGPGSDAFHNNARCR